MPPIRRLPALSDTKPLPGELLSACGYPYEMEMASAVVPFARDRGRFTIHLGLPEESCDLTALRRWQRHAWYEGAGNL